MFTLHDAIGLATWGHRHQTDKAGMPYIEHPLRVLNTVQSQGALPYVQIAAVLHDLTEDQPFTCDMLKTLGVPEPALEIVRLVDRDHSKAVHAERGKKNLMGNLHPDPSAPYVTTDSDTFYYREIRKNPGALMVKLADIEDNLQEYRLTYLTEATQDRLRAKYAKAKDILLGDK